MPVNILNLPGLNVLDFKETDDEYHVKATATGSCNSKGDVNGHWLVFACFDAISQHA